MLDKKIRSASEVVWVGQSFKLKTVFTENFTFHT